MTFNSGDAERTNNHSETQRTPSDKTVETPQGVAGVVGVAGEGGGPTIESIKELRRFEWREDESDSDNFAQFGTKLCELNSGLYRNGTGRQGLIFIDQLGKVTYVRTGTELLRITIDSLDVWIAKSNGNVASWTIPTAKLNAMLGTVCFLRNFRPLDRVVYRPTYRGDFTIIPPGYDPVERVYFIGKLPELSESIETTNKFLGAMSFATNADRTNTVSAKITSLLGNHWPGAKPFFYISANKSHAGKGTIVVYLQGRLKLAQVNYSNPDWPMIFELQSQMLKTPDIGFVNIDNVDIKSTGKKMLVISSAFLESTLTNRDLNLQAPGLTMDVSQLNDVVISLNTNFGQLSPDLLHRALPIRLNVDGDIDSRTSPIGNPKYEFLPQNADKLEAEAHGMIARWVAAGCPLDEDVSHPMLTWARVIGGILKVNGFTDFLGNYLAAKSVDDPIRTAIGTLASNHVGVPMAASEWVAVAKREGVVKTLLDHYQRENDKSMARALGVLFANHLEESFLIEQNGKQTRVKLEWRKKRWNPGETASRNYVFRDVAKDAEVADEPVPDAELSDELLALESEPIPLPPGTPKRKPR